VIDSAGVGEAMVYSIREGDCSRSSRLRAVSITPACQYRRMTALDIRPARPSVADADEE